MPGTAPADVSYDAAVVANANGHDRSPGAIEADIALTRDHLAHTLDEIAVRVDPRVVARRGAERMRLKADQARLQVVDADGRPRAGRLAVASGVLTAVVTAVVMLRRRR